MNFFSIDCMTVLESTYFRTQSRTFDLKIHGPINLNKTPTDTYSFELYCINSPGHYPEIYPGKDCQTIMQTWRDWIRNKKSVISVIWKDVSDSDR